MERSEIIKTFLSKGFQLDKGALDYLNSNQNKINKIIFYLESMEKRPLIVNVDIMKSTEENFSVQIFRKFDEGRRPKTIQEIVGYFYGRYKKISEILANRLELTNLSSLNKVTDKTKKFSVIASVKEIIENENAIVIEDLTSETKIFVDNDEYLNQMNLDDVLGFVCENDNGTIYARNILYPDIPLKKEISRTKNNLYCYFLSDLHLDNDFDKRSYDILLEKINTENEDKIIFVLGGISKNADQLEKFLKSLPTDAQKVVITTQEDATATLNNNTIKISDPCIVDVEDVKIFVSHGIFFEKYLQPDKTPSEALLKLIKKRHLNPTFEFSKKVYDQDPYFLDIVPDIFVVGHTHQPSSVNYKGTTVLSTGSLKEQPIFWKINLRTRENIKIGLR